MQPVHKLEYNLYYLRLKLVSSLQFTQIDMQPNFRYSRRSQVSPIQKRSITYIYTTKT